MFSCTPCSLSTDADRQGVDISVTVCLCFLFVYLFVRSRISPPRTRIAVSNFARRFKGRPRQKISHFVNLLPKTGRIGQRAGHAHSHVNITVEMRQHKRHARDAPFVKSREVWTQDRHVWIYVSPRRRTYFLSTHAHRQDVDISATVCFSVCACVCVCTVTDFSAENKASGVKFCTAVHRCPRQGITYFGQLFSIRSPKSAVESAARALDYRQNWKSLV